MAVAAIVIWHPKPEFIAEVEGLLLAMRDHTRAEPGCLQYDVHRTPDSRFVLYERYISREAIDQHHETPHYHELVRERGLALVQRREIIRCKVL